MSNQKEKAEKRRHRLFKYLRQDVLPTAFCPGCGCGIVLNYYAHADEFLNQLKNGLTNV